MGSLIKFKYVQTPNWIDCSCNSCTDSSYFLCPALSLQFSDTLTSSLLSFLPISRSVSHLSLVFFPLTFLHSSISITLYTLCPHSIIWLFPSFIVTFLSLLPSFPLSHLLSLILCHSNYPLFMAQSQSALKDHAISLRQRRSRSSRIGSWETGSPPRSGRVRGV